MYFMDQVVFSVIQILWMEMWAEENGTFTEVQPLWLDFKPGFTSRNSHN